MWIQVYGGANKIARIGLLNRSYDIFSVQMLTNEWPEISLN